MFEKQAIVEWDLVKGKSADHVREYPDYIARRTKETGFNNIVWDAGRSVVGYHSKLENVTRVHEKNCDQTHPNAILFRKRCPLRHGIEQAKQLGLPFAARLCMNRHYAGGAGTSYFAEGNPQLHCVTKEGEIDTTRLCYFFDEVKKERIDILNELAEIDGVDCIQLDFCRQPPHLAYHPKLVEAFMNQFGYDPKEIKTPYYTDYLEWFQFRADIMTDFMRQLKAKVESKAEIEARIVDCAPWLSIAYGLDPEVWCREGLVDKISLSPLLSLNSDPLHYPEYYVSIAHRYDVKCIGGIGSRGIIEYHNQYQVDMNDIELNYKNNKISKQTYAKMKKMSEMSEMERYKELYDREEIVTFVNRQYTAGVDGMSVYQAEMLMEMKWFEEDLQMLMNPEKTKAEYKNLGSPRTLRLNSTGTDWHSKVYMGKMAGSLSNL